VVWGGFGLFVVSEHKERRARPLSEEELGPKRDQSKKVTAESRRRNVSSLQHTRKGVLWVHSLEDKKDASPSTNLRTEKKES